MALINANEIPYGDRMMWAAVLRRAVFDYVLYKGVRSRSLDWKRASQYIFVENQRYENGLSFEEVCGLFGWDADYLRRLTTMLTRDDIKKMETTQLRDDFVFDEAKVLVERSSKWETTKVATPFLPMYQYTREYREKMTPKVVKKENMIGASIYLVRW